MSQASMLGPVYLDHAGVSVADLDRSHCFYRDVLGFGILEDAFTLAGHELRGRVLRNEFGARLELFERRNSQPGRPGHPIESTLVQGWFQAALSVQDVQRAFEHVVSVGAQPVLTPRMAPDGITRIAFIADPDGNLIELVQRPAWVTGSAQIAQLNTVPAPGILSTACFTVELDATEPHLDHHRPHGDPLLATAMGLELLAQASGQLLPQRCGLTASSIWVQVPCIIAGTSRRTIELRVVRDRDTTDTVATALVSAQANAADTTHLSACFRPSLPTAAATSSCASLLKQVDAKHQIDARAIYDLYFHGPSLRVIDHAWRHGSVVISRMAACLPASQRQTEPFLRIQPLLVELGLQTAGLLALALSGTMRIPHRIDIVENGAHQWNPTDHPTYAIARASSNADAMDIDITDHVGLVLLTIRGYRTVPLPFEIAADKLASAVGMLGGPTTGM